MNRIDFENEFFELNLKRKGEGYASTTTNNKWRGWVAASEAAEANRKWIVRRTLRAMARGAVIAAAALLLVAEVATVAHFAIRYW